MTVNALYYDTASNALTELQSSDLELLSQYVLYQLAQTTEFDLTPSSSGVSIGSFPDTSVIAAVSELVSDDAGTTIVYDTVYQAQTSSVSGSYPPDYVGYTVDGSSVVIQEQASTLDDLADEIITRLVGTTYGGPGSWYVGTSPPSDGGTWISMFSITDAYNTVDVGTTYYFWKKTIESSGTPTLSSITKRPLKIDGAGITELTNSDIDCIVRTVAERIATRGVNFYQISDTVPGTGTWTQASDTILDYASTITSQINETQYFSGTYPGGVTFAGYYTSQTGGNYYPYNSTPIFTGSTNYIGPSIVEFVANYVGHIEQNFITWFPYVGAVGSYTGPSSQLNYGGPTTLYPFSAYPFGAYYAGTGPANSAYFTGSTNYVGPSTTYTGPAPAYYAAPGYTSIQPVTYNFIANYIGGVVSPDLTLVTSYYLWRRVA